MNVDISLIEVGERQRKDYDSKELQKLRESISTEGLFHAPLVQPASDGKYNLIAGCRRYRAICELAKEGITFEYNGEPIFPGEMPVTVTKNDLEEVDLKIIELNENLIRQNLTWQEEANAISAIHELRQSQNPSHTRSDTALELAQLAGSDIKTVGEVSGRSREKVRQAEIIKKHINNPRVAKARNMKEAFAAARNLDLEAFNAERFRRLKEADKDAIQTEAIRFELKHGDMQQLFADMDEGQVDLILTDPPYGQGADSDSYTKKTGRIHAYKDDPRTAQKAIQTILLEGFQVCRSQANLLMFIDISQFNWAYEAASRAGWVPFMTPIIWQKSQSEGFAPWSDMGFRRTYECIFFATKGQKGLHQSPCDILFFKRVNRTERIHAAEKPLDLLSKLIVCSTMPGDTVLDPCAGSASTLVAARRLSRASIGFELNEETYVTAMSRMAEEAERPVATVGYSKHERELDEL